MVTWITDNVGYIPGAVNIGITKVNNQISLIDSGIDNAAINKTLKKIDEPVISALITHHHADHMGGCNKLEGSLNVKIYAPKREKEFFTKPLLEPMAFYGGAMPPNKLRNRHLEAKPIKNPINAEENPVAEIIPCPGHSLDHTAYLIEDVLFSGDAVFTDDIIQKYKLLFAIDPEKAGNSINVIQKANFEIMLPGHGSIQDSREDIKLALKMTEDHYRKKREEVLSIISEKLLFSQYLEKCIAEFKIGEIIKSRGVTQFFLYQASILGYLSNLLSEKKFILETDKSGLVIKST